MIFWGKKERRWVPDFTWSRISPFTYLKLGNNFIGTDGKWHCIYSVLKRSVGWRSWSLRGEIKSELVEFMSSEGKSQLELAQDVIEETNRGGWNQSPQQLLSHLQTNGVLTSSLPLAFPLGSLGESISNSEPAVCRFFPRAPSLQMAPASLQWLKQEKSHRW